MPAPEQTGYILVSIEVGDDDAPVRNPQDVARDIVDAGISKVVQAETVFLTDAGVYMRYGEASGGGSYTRLDYS